MLDFRPGPSAPHRGGFHRRVAPPESTHATRGSVPRRPQAATRLRRGDGDRALPARLLHHPLVRRGQPRPSKDTCSGMEIVLYEIFWSHFCEKARFSLDFKCLPYRLQAVNPFTRREAIRLGARGDVPVLVDGRRVIEGSSAIAAYLDEACPDPPLLRYKIQCSEASRGKPERAESRRGRRRPGLPRPPGHWLRKAGPDAPAPRESPPPAGISPAFRNRPSPPPRNAPPRKTGAA